MIHKVPDSFVTGKIKKFQRIVIFIIIILAMIIYLKFNDTQNLIYLLPLTLIISLVDEAYKGKQLTILETTDNGIVFNYPHNYAFIEFSHVKKITYKGSEINPSRIDLELDSGEFTRIKDYENMAYILKCLKDSS